MTRRKQRARPVLVLRRRPVQPGHLKKRSMRPAVCPDLVIWLVGLVGTSAARPAGCCYCCNGAAGSPVNLIEMVSKAIGRGVGIGNKPIRPATGIRAESLDLQRADRPWPSPPWAYPFPSRLLLLLVALPCLVMGWDGSSPALDYYGYDWLVGSWLVALVSSQTSSNPS